MSNPFEAFNISDDQDSAFKPVVDQKVKRTHQQKRIYKQQQEASKSNQAATNEPVLTEPLPSRIKEDAKQIRSRRAPPTPATKKLGEGHYLDRRSGTGRVDKPRKEGGGWGNIGNVKDQLNKDKYIKENAEDTKNESQNVIQGEKQNPTQQAPVEQKPEEPAALTLEQYYKSKGVEINNTYEKKTVAKKVDVNADWIKKEKLTVLQSKEDQKLQQRNSQNVVKFTSSKVGLSENLESLGLFEQKAPKKAEEKRDYRGKGKKQKVVVHQEDFPSLS